MIERHPVILALDTCLTACSAAVLDGETVLAARSESMPRGHQERLAPLVREVMAEAGIGFSDLTRIGVTVGPGSFTGLRVGLAFAKGLSAALGLPCVGVGALEAMALGRAGFVAAVIDARREQVYVQMFGDGVALMAPDALTAQDAMARLVELYAGGPATLVGSGAPLLAPVLPSATVLMLDGPDPVAVARLAQRGPAPAHPPRPLYLRAPDAKLPI
jgi:tRNA threonylcarbamoyladenosine biosynthesis protein TsaB